MVPISVLAVDGIFKACVLRVLGVRGVSGLSGRDLSGGNGFNACVLGGCGVISACGLVGLEVLLVFVEGIFELGVVELSGLLVFVG